MSAFFAIACSMIFMFKFFKSISFGLGFFLVVLNVHAFSCSEVFSASVNPIHNILSKPLNLSYRQHRILQNHPISKLFSEHPEIDKIQLYPHLDPREYRDDMDFSGERLQAGFLQSLLREAGFHGRFIKPEGGEPHRGDPLFLHITDMADQSPNGSLDSIKSKTEKFTIVEMSELKMANGKMDRRQASSVRSKYKVPRHQRVGHLYFHIPVTTENSYGPKNPNLLQAALKIKNEGFDIVIVSSISRFREDLPEEVTEFLAAAKKEFEEIIFLSDVQKGQTRFGGQSILILNDTTNQMPDIHKLSDTVLVVGPINFFEPLFSGTPTTVLLGRRNLDNYNKATADKMIANARLFPNFKHIDRLDDSLLIGATPITLKYNDKLFLNFLDLLHQQLIDQIEYHRSYWVDEAG